MTASLTAMCHWHQNRGTAQDQPHIAYHYGQPCPYEAMDAVLAGQPDPRDSVLSWEVDLPFPDGKPPLSLNDRGNHWATKAKKIELVKAITRNAVRAAAIPPLPHVHVELHYRPATNRFRDADNLVATLKPAIDALHQPDERSHWEPILPGDDPRFVTWSQPVFHPAVKGMSAATWLVLSTYEGGIGMNLTPAQIAHRPAVDDDGQAVLGGRIVQVGDQYGVIVGVRMDGHYYVRIASSGQELDLRIGQFEVMP